MFTTVVESSRACVPSDGFDTPRSWMCGIARSGRRVPDGGPGGTHATATIVSAVATARIRACIANDATASEGILYRVAEVEEEARQEDEPEDTDDGDGDRHELRDVDLHPTTLDRGRDAFVGRDRDVPAVERQQRHEVEEADEHVDRDQQAEHGDPPVVHGLVGDATEPDR